MAAGPTNHGSDKPNLEEDDITVIDVHLHLFEDLEENERILAQRKTFE